MLYQGPLGPRDFGPALDTWLRTRWAESRNPDLVQEAFWLPAKAAVDGRLDAFAHLWLESGVTGGNRDIELATFESFAAHAAIVQHQFDALDWMIKATRGDDFRRAKAEGRAAGFVSTQLSAGP